MGASGYSAFENDDALDWLDELEGAEDTEFLVDAFNAILDVGEGYIEIPEASIAIAAAEVVAALLGRAATSLPRAAKEWAERQSGVHPIIVEKARSAVNRVLEDSELQEVWEDSDNYSSWKASVDNLLERLA